LAKNFGGRTGFDSIARRRNGGGAGGANGTSPIRRLMMADDEWTAMLLLVLSRMGTTHDDDDDDSVCLRITMQRMKIASTTPTTHVRKTCALYNVFRSYRTLARFKATTTTNPPTTAMSSFSAARRIGPEVSRILFVKNLPFKASGEDLYKIFGKFGSLRQVRLGNGARNKGTAFIVFDDITCAKSAVESLTGFNVEGRYLNVLYFQPKKNAQLDAERQRQQVERLKQQYQAMEQEQQQHTT
jgi:pre-mRNA branch site protein p14